MNVIKNPNGTFFIVIGDTIAELTIKTHEDLLDFNRRISAAKTQEERNAVIDTIIKSVGEIR